jgi:hypothetical protein
MRSGDSARLAAHSAAIVAAAMLAAGCGSSAGSLATPQPTTNPGGGPSAESSPASPELHYPEQLDASRYVKDLCASLSDSQLRKLIGSKPNNGKHVVVPNAARGCAWQPASPDSPLNTIAIEWATKRKGGLKFLYRIRNERKHFQPTTVAGFPAVNTSGHDERSAGECVMNVGVNDQRAFFAQFQGSVGTNPCPKARQAAKYVIKNLKGGS